MVTSHRATAVALVAIAGWALGAAAAPHVVGSGARIIGNNRCTVDADCAAWQCDCACFAVSVHQAALCAPECVPVANRCDGKEAVCEAGHCALAAAAKPEVPPQGCTVEQPCGGPFFETCFAPGESIGCGICFEPGPGELCATDADCAGFGPLGICEQSPDVSFCLCSPAPICTTGCGGDAECAEGEVCDASHHCVAAPCTTAFDCPADFVCAPAPQGGTACKRRTCTTSKTCAGVCVKGRCYSTPGFCSAPPP